MDSLRDLQLKELEILKELKKVCEENGIQYFLFAGSLLGAIRHNGFIPWDDDLDTAMTLTNYHKFLEVCKNGKLKEGFFLQTPENEPEAGLSYSKLRMDGTTLIVNYLADRDIHHGINIDVYPLYKVSDNWLGQKVQFFAGALYMLMQAQHVPKHHGWMMKFGSALLLFILKGKLRELVKGKCLQIMEKYENKPVKYRCMLFGNTGLFKYLLKVEDFENTVSHVFEDVDVQIPQGYEDYLTCYYDNYMELPPEDERGAKMKDIVFYDTHNSYLVYRGIKYLTDIQGGKR